VNYLVKRGGAARASVDNLFTFGNIVGRSCHVQEGCNGVAQVGEGIAKSLHSRVLLWASDLVQVEGLGSLLELSPCLGGIDEHAIGAVLEVDNGSKSAENADLVLEVSKVVGKSRKHLRGALRVTKIANLRLSCLGSDIVNLGDSIVLAQLEEGVSEELRSLSVGVDVVVLSTVNCSTVVSKPDIVTSVGKDEGRRVLSVHDPPFSRGDEAVLQEESWCTVRDSGLSDMHHGELIAITSGHLMSLIFESIPSTNLRICRISIRVELEVFLIFLGLFWLPVLCLWNLAVILRSCLRDLVLILAEPEDVLKFVNLLLCLI